LTRAKRSSERRSFPHKSSFIVLRDRFSSCHKTSHPWAFLKAEALECRLLTDLWNLMTKSSPHKSSSELLLFHALEADRWGCAWSVYLDSDSDFGLSNTLILVWWWIRCWRFCCPESLLTSSFSSPIQFWWLRFSSCKWYSW
jgi:hypothetical protein